MEATPRGIISLVNELGTYEIRLPNILQKMSDSFGQNTKKYRFSTMGPSIIIIIFTYDNFYRNSLTPSLPPLMIVISSEKSYDIFQHFFNRLPPLLRKELSKKKMSTIIDSP